MGGTHRRFQTLSASGLKGPEHRWRSQYPQRSGGKAREGPDDVQGPEAQNWKLGSRSSGAGGRDRGGYRFSPSPPTPLQAIRAAGAHMFWCMRQPSAPTQPPPHRLRHTDTLPSRPPARLPAQAHSDALPAPLQAGPGSLSGVRAEPWDATPASFHTHTRHTHTYA